MSVSGIGHPIDVAVSALRAQSAKMKVISGNIANVNTTRTENGEPYRRQDVVLSANPDVPGGVSLGGITQDNETPFGQMYQPGHPDADENGYVKTPNVQLASEMIQMMSANRAYQANTATLKRYQQMVDTTLELLR